MPDCSSAELVTAVGSPIRCHRCSYYCGEATVSLRLVAVVKEPEIRDLIPPPRAIWLCPKCGWQNIYRQI